MRDFVVEQQPPMPNKRHSFRPLLFVDGAPDGRDLMPESRPAPLPPSTRAANDSHVRIRAQVAKAPPAADVTFLDAQDLLDELCEDQLTLSVNLACLEEAAAFTPLRALRARHADLCALRDALGNVHSAMSDRRLQRLVVPDAPLAEYLRGIYAWVHAVVRALDHLVGSLRSKRADWALLRWRIEEAKNFHFDELQDPIRSDVFALAVVANGGSFGPEPPAIDELQYAIERLIATANALEEHLDERFG